ncbi:MAG: holin [Eubacterium sp.]
MNKKWFKAAVIRAVKTMAQTAVSLITVGNLITDLDWVSIISISATAGVVSILTSIAGLPEVESEE